MTPPNEMDSTGSNVPEQKIGSEMNAVEKAVFSSKEKAKAFFSIAKNRLLEVSRWKEISKPPLSTFTLTDHSGHQVERAAKEGDYFKIDIPGPGSSTGDGYDWVIIEKIVIENTEETDLASMTVRPAANPKSKSDHVAHFLKDSATSTFQIKRSGNEVSAEEHGRNEVPNTDTRHVIDNIRNTFVGWSAKLGLSYPQWKSLVAGLVDAKISKHDAES